MNKFPLISLTQNSFNKWVINCPQNGYQRSFKTRKEAREFVENNYSKITGERILVKITIQSKEIEVKKIEYREKQEVQFNVSYVKPIEVFQIPEKKDSFLESKKQETKLKVIPQREKHQNNIILGSEKITPKLFTRRDSRVLSGKTENGAEFLNEPTIEKRGRKTEKHIKTCYTVCKPTKVKPFKTGGSSKTNGAKLHSTPFKIGEDRFILYIDTEGNIISERINKTPFIEKTVGTFLNISITKDYNGENIYRCNFETNTKLNWYEHNIYKNKINKFLNSGTELSCLVRDSLTQTTEREVIKLQYSKITNMVKQAMKSNRIELLLHIKSLIENFNEAKVIYLWKMKISGLFKPVDATIESNLLLLDLLKMELPKFPSIIFFN